MSATIDNKALNAVILNLDTIDADRTFNVRISDDSGERGKSGQTIAELAKLLTRDGQMTPVMVRLSKKKGKEGRYELVQGFRRVAAMRSLGWTTVKAQVVDLDDQQAFLLNLQENLARKDITTYELAARCAFLSKKFTLSGDSIANRLGVGRAYVNNLIRYTEKIHPKIVEAWKNGNAAVTMTTLSAWHKLSKEDQVKAFEDVSTERTPNGESETPKEKAVKSRKREVLMAVRASVNAAVKEHGGYSEEWLSGFNDAILFACSALESVGPYTMPAKSKPGRKPKEETTEDEDADEEQVSVG